MKKKLRLISLSLMLAMIAGTAVSCNSKGEQTETTEGDTTVVNLTMYEWGWEGPEEGMDEVAPLIKEATGVEINLSRWIVNSEEDYRRQMSLWTSANTLPEMMTVPADNYTTQLVNELGDAGRLWEVDILLDKVFEEAKESLEDSMTLYQSQDTGKKYFYVYNCNGNGAIVKFIPNGETMNYHISSPSGEIAGECRIIPE